MSDSQPGLRNRWTRGEIVFFLSVGVVCLAVLIVIGKMSATGLEKWDTPLFAQLLLPIAAAGAFFGGFLFPGHSWRWGVAPWWMQHVYMLWDTGRETSGPLPLFSGGWRFCRSLLWRGLVPASQDMARGSPVTEKLMSSNPRLKTDVENARLEAHLFATA